MCCWVTHRLCINYEYVTVETNKLQLILIKSKKMEVRFIS